MAKIKKQTEVLDTLDTLEVIETFNEAMKISEEVVKQPEFKNVPPFDWSRNQWGLLNHINYVFNEDGSVNWRAMVPNEYLVPNKQNFKRRNQEVPKSIEGLDDRDLLVLLAGIKHLASLRGFTKVNQEVVSASDSYVAVKTTITLLPNYETNNQIVEFSDLADATHFNTGTDFPRYYLNSIAANRGFVRAWRNALKLPITAFDEIGETPKEEINNNQKQSSLLNPLTVLKRKLDEKNISFDKLKQTCIDKKFDNSESWENLNDITNVQIQKIIEGFNEKEAKLESKNKLLNGN